ncbi:hypothetical protein H1C71_025737 [Ictidomys tridecemlineatus]|nr:hypothetical protein H1C71_025737 [Ictidomys tridecemlineatus]
MSRLFKDQYEGTGATGSIFLAEGTARATVWRPRTACYGQCQTHVHSFLFLILHCGMKGFVHSKAIPDIKRLIEEVFWDVRREERPFPKPAEPHWVSSCLQRPRLQTDPKLKTNPADSQQLLWCQGCTSERERAASPQPPQSREGEEVSEEGMAKLEGILRDRSIQQRPPRWEGSGTRTLSPGHEESPFPL